MLNFSVDKIITPSFMLVTVALVASRARETYPFVILICKVVRLASLPGAVIHSDCVLRATINMRPANSPDVAKFAKHSTLTSSNSFLTFRPVLVTSKQRLIRVLHHY